MIDIDGLRKDPRFLKLPPDKQAALLSKAKAENAASAPASPLPTSAATPVPDWWGRNIAQPLTKGMQQMAGVPPGLTKAIFPQTTTAAATDTAALGANLLIPGSGILPALGRTAAVGGVGALVDAVQGKDPIMGGISGAAKQVTGELVAPPINWLGSMGKKALNKADLGRVGDFIGSIIPGLNPKTAEDFDTEFPGGGATRRVGAKLGKFQDQIAKKFGGKPIIPGSVPSTNLGGKQVNTLITFDEAVQQIRELNDEGKYVGNDANLRLAAKQARDKAHALTQATADALEKQQPGLGTSFLNARREYGKVATLSQLFSEPELWRPDGRVDWTKLMQLMRNRGGAGYRDELTRNFGPQGTNALLAAVNRGAPPTVRDVEGQGMLGTLGQSVRAFIHPSGVPSLYAHMPFHSQVLGTQVGRVPRYFAKLPPAAPAMLLGQNISDIINSGDSDAAQ